MPSKKYGLTLFIFRRDLRLHDNTGLIKACRESETVIPAFLFHKDLTDPKGIKFRPNLIQFMLESLRELNNSLSERGSELYIFYNDDYYHGLEKILTEYKIDAVFVNEDYTPYSGKRDNKIKEICIKNNIKFINCFDLLLTRPGDVLTGDGKPYKVFSSFFNKAKKISVEKPLKSLHRNFYHSRIRGRKPMDFLSGILNTINKDIAQRGGRKAAVKVLRKISDFKDYDRKRDFPSLAGTTMLSAHMKFGTVSAREFYWSVRNGLGIKSSLITELFWRDFYAHLSFFFPHVFGQSFNKKYQDIKWLNSKTMFQSWCEGMTGVPIVDAE